MNPIKIGSRLIFKNSPLQVTFFVTAKCNMRCKMCFYMENVAGPHKDELTIDEIEKISRSMPDIMWLLISGGEPFLRDDLPEICGAFEKNNKTGFITIPTNGYLTDRIREISGRILSKCKRSHININLSINGIGGYHDEICGVKGAYEKLVETNKAISELKRKYKNLGAGIIITHTAHNEDKLNGLVDHIIGNFTGIDNIGIGYQFENPFKNNKSGIRLGKYIEAQNYLRDKYFSKNLRYFNFPLKNAIFAKDLLVQEMVVRLTRNPAYQIPCFAGRLNVVIDEHGEVTPCEFFNKSMGNLRDFDYSLPRLLSGGTARRMRNCIRNSRCFCKHECYLTTNLLFNPAQYLNIYKTMRRFNKGKFRIS